MRIHTITISGNVNSFSDGIVNIEKADSVCFSSAGTFSAYYSYFEGEATSEPVIKAVNRQLEVMPEGTYRESVFENGRLISCEQHDFISI